MNAGIICAGELAGKPNSNKGKQVPVLRERFRLMRQAYSRGMARDFRSRRNGGPHTILPIVAK